MKPNLKQIAKKIKDKNLREKVLNLIEDPTICIGDNTYHGLPLGASPASKRQHHSYRAGLAQHTASSSRIALTLCDVAENIYNAEVDRDVALAAVIAHDMMKPLTYKLIDEGYYDSSPLGEKMDHLTLIVSKLIEKGFPLEVVHAVAAHHGDNGPMSPRTVEALICFLSDYADAALNGEVLKAAKSLVEQCAGERVEHLNAEEAFTIVNAKQRDGCDGVKRVFEKMKHRENIETS